MLQKLTLEQLLPKLPQPISGGVEPDASAKSRHLHKLDWWTKRVEIPEANVLPVILEDGGYMPPETEAALAQLAKRVHDSRAQEMAAGGMPRPVFYGHFLHSLAGQLGLANQVADARLTLRYIRECVPTVVPL